MTDQDEDERKPPPPFKGLSFLDRLLVVWIILSMAIGIILGNLVPSTGPALQRGTFVGVSVPIGMGTLQNNSSHPANTPSNSRGPAGDDVSDPL